jgi:nitroreductase
MGAFECVATKLDVREFSTRHVAGDVKLKVLEAARMTGTGMNTQHWRFIVVQDRDGLKRLAADSSTGAWVGNAAFAVIVLTDPKYGFHLIDAGRAVQNMEIAAWNEGVVSCLYTGIKEDSLRRDFGIPNELRPTVVVGFGYPTRTLTGRKKNRKPLEEVAFLEKYGHRMDRQKLGG